MKGFHCDKCGGSGLDPRNRQEDCQGCGGWGDLRLAMLSAAVIQRGKERRFPYLAVLAGMVIGAVLTWLLL